MQTLTLGAFPKLRLRRPRQSAWCRELVQEHRLSPADLILPLFVHEEGQNVPVASMPGVVRHSLEGLVDTAKRAHRVGIPAIALFPVVLPGCKSEDGAHAWNSDNLMCRAIRAVKAAVPELGVIADVALDPYTTHGHDGIVVDGRVDNDLTVAALVRQALTQAKAGADILAPSDMQDGRIGIIRDALEHEGLVHTMLMSYTAKYASAFYGPFRDAIGSQQVDAIDKSSYQQHVANGAEALREAELDLAEGADMLMVKPGMPFLDVLWRVKSTFQCPTMVYQVSGEYTMLKLLAEHTGQSFEALLHESLLCCKRAGADAIVSYGALAWAEGMKKPA